RTLRDRGLERYDVPSRRRMRIAGEWVAAFTDGLCCGAGVAVLFLDLRTGRRYEVMPVRAGESEAELPDPPRIREFVLDAHGAGGWIQSFRGRRELFVFDRNGADVLGVSEGHDLRSLRVRDRRLRWRQGGRP